MQFKIHPSVGIARVGNSPEQFYSAPDALGGLPAECAADGTPLVAEGKTVPVTKFKDQEGRVRRQAAYFKIFVYDGYDPRGQGREAILGKDLVKVEWTVHLANKKAVWYNFSELEGDLTLGADNSYAKRKVPFRNVSVQGEAERRKLIIDPGPRTLTGPGQRAEFSKGTIPKDYKYGSFPEAPSQGFAITTLGEMLTNAAGSLSVLGGFGHAGGNETISSFAGADSWHDDISDGAVTCRITLANGEVHTLDAWVIVGSPKFAPELVNIVTLADIAFDVGVRFHRLDPQMFDEQHWPQTHGWNPGYKSSYERDVEPLLKRFAGYQWVANTPMMNAFSAPPFDPRDPSPALLDARKTYFQYFRKPGATEVSGDGQENQLLGQSGFPLMPMNSGSNSVGDQLVDKFLTLTLTQYFLLGQWAEGKFEAQGLDLLGIHPLDHASLGNCVGSPMCPGIEVTWSTRNAAIYSQPFRLAHRQADYRVSGLSCSRDECEGGGCEPGDLTKRMAIPWQADFFQCTVQFINFTDPKVNKQSGIPKPPTYYAYWWPPQSPMFVLTGLMDANEQAQAGVPSGFQVYYARGVNTFAEMILAWSYLGFVNNRNTAPERAQYPYFEEVERNHQAFVASSVAVGSVGNFVNNTDSTFLPMWFLKDSALPTASSQARQAEKKVEASKLGKLEPVELAREIKPAAVGRLHRSER